MKNEVALVEKGQLQEEPVEDSFIRARNVRRSESSDDEAGVSAVIKMEDLIQEIDSQNEGR